MIGCGCVWAGALLFGEAVGGMYLIYPAGVFFLYSFIDYVLDLMTFDARK